VITLRVPALRERREDILPLAEWLLNVAALRNGRPGLALSPGATTATRELSMARQRPRTKKRNRTRHRPDARRDDRPRRPPRLALPRHNRPPRRNPAAPSASLDEVERDHIARVLAASATLEEAADTLGINVTTLWRKRRRYGIE